MLRSSSVTRTPVPLALLPVIGALCLSLPHSAPAAPVADGHYELDEGQSKLNGGQDKTPLVWGVGW